MKQQAIITLTDEEESGVHISIEFKPDVDAQTPSKSVSVNLAMEFLKWSASKAEDKA